MQIHSRKFRTQSGAVLLISMIMLLVLTLIGITGMRVSSLEEKMAGNAKEINLTFQAAETALRGVEAQLGLATNPSNTYQGANGYYPDINVTERWESLKWDSTDSITYHLSLGGVSGAKVQFIVEELPAVQGESLEPGPITQKYYRITTHAIGSSDTAIVELQAIYKR